MCVVGVLWSILSFLCYFFTYIFKSKVFVLVEVTSMTTVWCWIAVHALILSALGAWGRLKACLYLSRVPTVLDPIKTWRICLHTSVGRAGVLQYSPHVNSARHATTPLLMSYTAANKTLYETCLTYKAKFDFWRDSVFQTQFRRIFVCSTCETISVIHPGVWDRRDLSTTDCSGSRHDTVSESCSFVLCDTIT